MVMNKKTEKQILEGTRDNKPAAKDGKAPAPAEAPSHEPKAAEGEHQPAESAPPPEAAEAHEPPATPETPVEQPKDAEAAHQPEAAAPAEATPSGEAAPPAQAAEPHEPPATPETPATETKTPPPDPEKH